MIYKEVINLVGKYYVCVSSSKDEFNFEISRKYTILRGWSGTGKSLLCHMLELGNKSGNGVSIRCEIPVKSITDISTLAYHGKSIIVLDEGIVKEMIAMDNLKSFISSTEKTDSYFVLISRAKMTAIPYSVLEIYSLERLKSSSKKTKYYFKKLEGSDYAEIMGNGLQK